MVHRAKYGGWHTVQSSMGRLTVLSSWTVRRAEQRYDTMLISGALHPAE